MKNHAPGILATNAISIAAKKIFLLHYLCMYFFAHHIASASDFAISSSVIGADPAKKCDRIQC